MTTTPSLPPASGSRGELLIWTSVDPDHEHDFNQWYDQEHMQERAAIKGFRWSRRYHSSTCARPYLALYQTDTLQVFTSEPYKQAFSKQTQWSQRNFTRMRDTKRRVNSVTTLAGAGTGAYVALVCLGIADKLQAASALARTAPAHFEGLLSIRLLCPDPVLSTPLPSEDLSNRVLEAYLVIEATTERCASDAGVYCSTQLQLAGQSHHVFKLLWDLQSADL